MPVCGNPNRLIRGFAVAGVALLAACGGGSNSRPTRRAVVRQTSAGDVALDSVTQAVNAHWLTDANVVALIGLVDQRQMDLAHAEMQAWASDTVQMLASNMARTYAAQQQSLDSLAATLKLTGALPAIGAALDTSLQQHTAVLTGLGAARLDSAFLSTAEAQDNWAADYFDQLSAIATAPELASFAAAAANRATLQASAIRNFVTQRAAGAGAAKDTTQSADSTRRRARTVQ